MMCQAPAVLLFFLLLSTAAADAAGDSPISKVLELLAELQAKVISDGKAEEISYVKFQGWCEDTVKTLQNDIQSGAATVEDTSAVIEKASADIEVGSAKIDELAEHLASSEADLKAATNIREKERADFEASDNELAGTIDALIRAQAVLQEAIGKGGSLVQMNLAMGKVTTGLKSLVEASSIFSDQDRSKLTALLQANAAARAQDSESSGAEDAESESEAEIAEQLGAGPAPDAYKHHSTGILDVLADMLDKARAMQGQGQKEELNAKHNYEMMRQSLMNEMSQLEKDMSATKSANAASEQARAVAEGDKAVAASDLAEDKKKLEETQLDCTAKAQDWEESQKSRAEEIKALEDAQKIIKGMTGDAADRAYGSASSLLQTGVVKRRWSGSANNIVEAADAIRSLARKMHNSRALGMLATQIRSLALEQARGGLTDDPFAKVKGLIEDMIERLLKEAEAEAGQKAFCDRELSKTEKKKKTNTAEIDKLSSKVASEEARIAKLTEEIGDLEKELADLAASQAELDAMRQQEHEEFLEAKKDYSEGLEGVQMALKILNDYYSKDQGQVVSLLQVERQPTVANHQASSESATGIIGMLEVAESDFANLLSETKTNENLSQDEYKKITNENKLSIATKENDVKYKTREKGQLEKSVAEAKVDISNIQGELDAVLEYLSSLRAQCIAKPMPFEEKQKARQEEIASLREALQILEGTTVLVQTGETEERVVQKHEKSAGRLLLRNSKGKA